MKQNKNINFLQFAFTYLGAFLGVGYVSGRELWEFFGSFGKYSHLGLLISCISLCLFGIITVKLINLSNEETVDRILVIQNNKFIKLFISLITYSSMYLIFVIMVAGSGTIFESSFGINKTLGSLLFVIAIFISVISGVYNIVKILSLVIPVIICMTIFICLKTLSTYNITFSYENINNNPLLSNWLLSAIIYLSTNALASLGTLFAIAPFTKSNKHTICGSIITSIILFFVGFAIILTMSAMQYSVKSDLPMLYVATKHSSFYGVIYSILLLIGMFSAAIGNTTTLALNIKNKFLNNNQQGLFISILIICLSGIIISNLGFTGLIKCAYPIIGYFGLPVIFFIVLKYIYLINKR